VTTRLNHLHPLLIVRGMRRFLVLTTFLLLAGTLPAFSQSMELGMNIGIGEGTEDGFDFDLDESMREVYFGTELEPGTVLKAKAGQYDGELFGDSGSIEYINALIEYRFPEVFGSSSMFLGPGFYRTSPDDSAVDFDDDSGYGLSAGVNAAFPVSRRFAFTAELAYHWAHVQVPDVDDEAGSLEDEYSFVALSGGFRFGF
jgi:hypothetical protein